jgi:hypothetical protein
MRKEPDLKQGTRMACEADSNIDQAVEWLTALLEMEE